MKESFYAKQVYSDFLTRLDQIITQAMEEAGQCGNASIHNLCSECTRLEFGPGHRGQYWDSALK
jgi:hypothetical protein